MLLTVSRMWPGLTITFILLAAAGGAQQVEKHLQLQAVPGAVYKVDDPGHGETETWVFNVVAGCAADDCNWKPIAATAEQFAANTLIDKIEMGTQALETSKLTSYRAAPDTPLASARRGFLLEEAFDLRLTFTRAKKLGIDRTRVRMMVANSAGRREEAVLEVPILVYHQKVALSFPFRGPGIVMQGWVNDGGHSGYANQFAVDVMGLDANYAPQINDKDENESYAGWDREILAPADGMVVYARNDVPNNSAAKGPDQKVLDSQHDPVMAVAGNCVIIDHGNSEFSVMMHMRQGSVVVKAGDRVKQGNVIGHEGNSGDSFGPHLHYQLQAGPELFHAQSLPFTFQNLKPHLFRGTYFRAK
jgi:peptidase M23-like protein